jgi:hypothetical protein
LKFRKQYQNSIKNIRLTTLGMVTWLLRRLRACKDPISKITRAKRARSMAQLVEHKLEALNSNCKIIVIIQILQKSQILGIIY